MMDNRKIYQSKEFAEAWHNHKSKNEDILRTRLMNSILLKNINVKNKIVLESGCGDGFFVNYLLKLKPKKVYAFDISKYLVDIAREEYKSVDFKVADIMKKFPYKNNLFDVSFCYCVIMENPNIRNSIKELARVTKKSGYIHVVVVHPIYNLFINDKKAEQEPILTRLGRYTKEEHLTVTTLPGFDNFVVYRRPIDSYVNEFIKNKLKIEKMIEVPVSEELAEINEKYKERIGIPVFVYFKLRK